MSLPAEVYSSDHLSIALWELGNLIDHVRNASARTAVAKQASEQESLPLSAFLTNILTSAGVAANDLVALEKLQAELKLFRDKAPTAHLVLAAMPNQTMKKQLVDWFRREIHAQHLVTFSVRADIGGGFLLRIGSKQYDFTYRAQLLKDKHRLTEIFDNVR